MPPRPPRPADHPRQVRTSPNDRRQSVGRSVCRFTRRTVVLAAGRSANMPVVLSVRRSVGTSVTLLVRHGRRILDIIFDQSAPHRLLPLSRSVGNSVPSFRWFFSLSSTVDSSADRSAGCLSIWLFVWRSVGRSVGIPFGHSPQDPWLVRSDHPR